jgi:DNA modification methylase
LPFSSPKRGLRVDRVSANEWLVADPFIRSGTTALTALKLGRQYVGIEQSEEYMRLANPHRRASLKIG